MDRRVIRGGGLVPDPFAVLAAGATATEHVELGTSTVQVPLHHPADLAHRVRSLMAVCDDRLTIGSARGRPSRTSRCSTVTTPGAS